MQVLDFLNKVALGFRKEGVNSYVQDAVCFSLSNLHIVCSSVEKNVSCCKHQTDQQHPNQTHAGFVLLVYDSINELFQERRERNL